jgi:hypothetical protein
MDVVVWLRGLGLGKYEAAFRDNDIDETVPFFYINDDQQLVDMWYDNWKLVFLKQRAPGTLLVWANPFTNLRVPKIFNLRTDYERAYLTSNTYYDS